MPGGGTLPGATVPVGYGAAVVTAPYVGCDCAARAAIEADADTEIVVDMERLVVEVPAAGIVESFPIDPATQHRFLNGLDDVGITMTHADEIADYESSRPAWLP